MRASLVAALAFLTTTALASAAPPAPIPVPPGAGVKLTTVPPLHLDVQRYTLPNGLRVVLSVDHTSPTIAVDLMYDVGSRNEERGHSGFAHLFEHMMFQGSKNVARGEHFQLVASRGGTLNANTSDDRTNYFELLPQSDLALALWLEADRLKSLEVTQKNLDNQRAVVEEEFRMRILNAADTPSELRLAELVFQGYWPYEHPTIGSMQDLEAARLEWVRAFHDAHYAPNNAVLAVSGDLDAAGAKELVAKYFGDAKPATLPKYDPAPMPEQTAPREAVVDDVHARLPMIREGWAIPPNREPDHYALEVAAFILSDGESSRLYRNLVREKGLAVQVDAGTDDHRGPDMFEIQTQLSDKGTVPAVDKILDDEVGALARTGPTEEEMKKVTSRLTARIFFGLQSNYARAERLASFELFYGDAGLINTELDRYLAVTRDDVKRAVAKYLTTARRSHVEVRPASEGAGGGKDAKDSNANKTNKNGSAK